MHTMMNRVLTKFVLIAVLAAAAMFVVGCFGGDDAASEEPDTDATIVAATVKTILEATSEARVSEVPTDTPAPTATPEPPPTATMAPTLPPTPVQAAAPSGSGGSDPGSGGEPLAPLPLDDPEALMGELSDGERACLAQSGALPPDRMQLLMMSPELATPEERDAFLGCLGHDQELRMMLTGVLTATGPLSVESSDCLRDSYADVDLEELLNGMVADPGNDAAAQQAMARGMVMFIVSLSCLNEDEFAAAGQAMGFMPGEYEAFQCVLEAAGGQEELVVWLSPGAEFPAELLGAAAACGLQMGAGPPPG